MIDQLLVLQLTHMHVSKVGVMLSNTVLEVISYFLNDSKVTVSNNVNNNYYYDKSKGIAARI